MKKLLIFVLSGLAVLALDSCSYKDDINALRRDQAVLKAELDSIRDLQNYMNTRVSDIYSLVNADDYVTGITPMVDADGNVTGITISFSKSPDQTIELGSGPAGDVGGGGNDGEDDGDGGEVSGNEGLPVIGLRAGTASDPDPNAYYWTVSVDGGPPTDILVNGAPVPATGPSGSTPVVALRPGTASDPDPGNYYWTIRIGSGPATDILVDGLPVPATGEKGDSWILDIDDSDPYFVTFILNDNNDPHDSFTIAKYRPNGLDVALPASFTQSVTTAVPYTFYDPVEPLEAFVMEVSPGWTVTADRAAQVFNVSSPAAVDDKGWAFVLGFDGRGNTWSRMLNLSTKVLNVGDVYYEGGVPSGIVIRANDGTSGSGLVVSLAEGGPFSTETSGEIDRAFGRAKTWAADLPGGSWVLYGTSDYIDMFNADIAPKGLSFFNTSISNLNSSNGTSYPAIRTGINYWTSEYNGYGSGSNIGFRMADAVQFSESTITSQSIRIQTEGTYARAYRPF